MSKEFLEDFYSDTEPGLKEFIETKTKETLTSIVTDFKNAQKKDWFRKDINPSLIIAVA
jgi:hypothetical protein